MRADSTNQKRLLVIGGNGFVGRHVCRYAVQKGFKVTSMSRRGECPIPDDKWLSQVEWKSGNALDKKTVVRFVQDADAVVHTIGLLFDARAEIRALVVPHDDLPDQMMHELCRLTLGW